MFDQMYEWSKNLRVYNIKPKKRVDLYRLDRPHTDGLTYRYSQYSENYWAGVKERREAYRLRKINQLS